MTNPVSRVTDNLLPCPFCDSEVGAVAWMCEATDGLPLTKRGTTSDPDTAEYWRNSATVVPLYTRPHPQQVEVKALPWKDNSKYSVWTGELIFGVYYLIDFEGSAFRVHRGQFLTEHGTTEVAFVATLEAAKTAAQADYERRILSALNHAPEASQSALSDVLEALTPSAETKAAYIGEFHFNYTVWDPSGEYEIPHSVAVPWTTIKEIMGAIRSRALSKYGREGK